MSSSSQAINHSGTYSSYRIALENTGASPLYCVVCLFFFFSPPLLWELQESNTQPSELIDKLDSGTKFDRDDQFHWTLLWPETLPAGLAGDLHARSIYPPHRLFLHFLSFFHLLMGSLPHMPRSGEF